MKDVNLEIARQCKSIAENWIFEGNAREFNLELDFHLSNEEILERPAAKTYRVGSLTDASEVIADNYNDGYNKVIENVNRFFLNKIDIYKPLYLHFMTKNQF